MTAHVETMAYTNEVPWHGLGTRVSDNLSVDSMLEKAGLNWRVEKEKIFLGNKRGDKYNQIEDHFALVRDSDRSVLDIVGPRYVPTQNEQAFSFFKEFVNAGSAKMETAGSLKGGRYVWGLANLGKSFKLANNDEVKGYLFLASPHERGKSVIIRFTSIRVVCMNTLTLALREVGTVFRSTHHAEFGDLTIQKAKETLGIARDKLGEFESNARLIQKIKLTNKDAIKLLAPIYQPTTDVKLLLADFDEHARKKFRIVMDAYNNAPGAQPGNGWGLLNAVTYVSDHILSRDQDRRLTNAWIGETAIHKEKIFETLLEMR